MKREKLEVMWNMGDLGLRNGHVLADVSGTRVILIAAFIGDDEENVLPSVTLSVQEKIKDKFKDLSGISDAVHDWENPDPLGAA